ncbi:hypothetical protein CC1G_00715 [Coprinopsis cinerea okayama7|uniref:Uncharacterized protein n=1 Tax=Coprinopsis cinerea (strain Okayama-7 / 130 / ATCC MYA-4618 / FGSC 9003) TaxID=240176 RepID=A8N3U5_COPC7|nr:hypothetical protein CC1G_00715 [Coprinopsis cinerea okayama7\|eukprot:XP_001829536.2 hypothetical protein CC1G_00715 [Coprinopsis cinerea okayama7\
MSDWPTKKNEPGWLQKRFKFPAGPPHKVPPQVVFLGSNPALSGALCGPTLSNDAISHAAAANSIQIAPNTIGLGGNAMLQGHQLLNVPGLGLFLTNASAPGTAPPYPIPQLGANHLSIPQTGPGTVHGAPPPVSSTQATASTVPAAHATTGQPSISNTSDVLPSHGPVGQKLERSGHGQQMQSAAENAKDVQDWPNGIVKREVEQGAEPPGWKDSKWVWTSQSCLKCGLTGPSAKSVVTCSICNGTSHLCIKGGRWDELMMGTYILVDMSSVVRYRRDKSVMWFPAKIISRKGIAVTLEWHEANLWPPKAPLIDRTFTLTVLECSEARYRQYTKSDTHSFGAIKWPVELVTDDLSKEQYDYLIKNDHHDIVKAVDAALPTVIHILQTPRIHPIKEVMNYHMKLIPSTLKGRQRQEHIALFRQYFSLPVFPAHRALLTEHCQSIHNHISTGDEGEIAVVALMVLLELVIIRQYLKATPAHDAEIYELSRIPTQKEYDLALDDDIAFRGRIVRDFTEHEKAFNCADSSSAQGEESAPVAGSTKESASHLALFQKLHLSRHVDMTDNTVQVPHPSELIRLLEEDGQPYILGSTTPVSQLSMQLEDPPQPSTFGPARTEPLPFPLHQNTELTGGNQDTSTLQPRLRRIMEDKESASPAGPRKLAQTKLPFKPLGTMNRRNPPREAAQKRERPSAQQDTDSNEPPSSDDSAKPKQKRRREQPSLNRS